MFARRQPPVPATLYTRRDCPLCDRLVADLERARLDPPPTLTRVDVDADEALVARFGDWVPVLELQGTLLVRGTWSLPELERRWNSLAGARPEERPC